MSRFKKTKAQLNRERLEKQEREAAERRAQKRIDVLTAPRKHKSEKPSIVFEVPKKWRPDEKQYPSMNNGIEPVRSATKKKQYAGEMAEREAEAQKEIAAKKKRVAPLFNKGGYQFITDGTDPKDIGRKTSAT